MTQWKGCTRWGGGETLSHSLRRIKLWRLQGCAKQIIFLAGPTRSTEGAGSSEDRVVDESSHAWHHLHDKWVLVQFAISSSSTPVSIVREKHFYGTTLGRSPWRTRPSTCWPDRAGCPSSSSSPPSSTSSSLLSTSPEEDHPAGGLQYLMLDSISKLEIQRRSWHLSLMFAKNK